MHQGSADEGFTNMIGGLSGLPWHAGYIRGSSKQNISSAVDVSNTGGEQTQDSPTLPPIFFVLREQNLLEVLGVTMCRVRIGRYWGAVTPIWFPPNRKYIRRCGYLRKGVTWSAVGPECRACAVAHRLRRCLCL